MIVPKRTIPTVTTDQWKGTHNPASISTNPEEMGIYQWVESREGLTRQDLLSLKQWCSSNKYKVDFITDTFEMAADHPRNKQREYPLHEKWLSFKPPTETMELWLARSSSAVGEWLNEKHHIPKWKLTTVLRKLLTTQLTLTQAI